MRITGKIWGKIIGISIVAALLDMLFHALFAPTYPYDYTPSYFVQNGLFPPAAAISLLIIFFLLAVVFTVIQERLPGGKVSKGLRFGVSFGGLWLIGVPGMTVFLAAPLAHEVAGGASDCAALIILGLLLGAFTGTAGDDRSRENPVRMLAAVPIIAVFFILGQYLAFVLMTGTPQFDLYGTNTLIWTIILAVWAGAVYVLLHRGVPRGYTLLERALFFGGVIVGVNWLLFNLFVLLFVAMPGADPFILAILNIVSIIVGMWVFETIVSRGNGGPPERG